jgi:IPT/TIG domain-containing protein
MTICIGGASRAAIFLSLLIVAACGGGGGAAGPPPPPIIESIVPSTATRGGPAFTLTVNGSNFVTGSAVEWNGTNRTTVFVSSSIQPADGLERVPNGDFSSGAQSWILHGQTQLVASDRGTGQMVQVSATASQFATLHSTPFPITPGAPFQVSFFAHIPPSLVQGGYFLLAFTDGTVGNFLEIPGTSAGAVRAESLPFTPGKTTVGQVTTDFAGNYQLSLRVLGTSQVVLEATYAGDAQHWPGYACVGP